MNPLILVVMLLLLMATIDAQLSCEADKPCSGPDCFKEHDGGSHDWTKGCPNGDLTRCFEIVTPDYNRCNDKDGRCEHQYDPSKGPVCEKDAKGLCKDTVLPEPKNPELTRIVSQKEVDVFKNKYHKNIDLQGGARVDSITASVLNTITGLIEVNKEVYVLSGYRDKNHPLERSKPNGPGRHTDPNAAVDIAPVDKNGNPTWSWKANNYSREKTQAIVDQMKAIHPRAICLYNDPNIIGCKPYPDHDNHMHFDFGYDDMSPIAKEFLKTHDPTELFKVVEKLQKERLEPGGIEHQKALYDQIAKERYHENLCAKLAKNQQLRGEAAEKYRKACYEAWLREQSSQNGQNTDHGKHGEVYGDKNANEPWK